MTTAPQISADPDFPRADPATLARFAGLASSLITDSMERRGTVDSRIQTVWPGARLAASAFTVWTRPGDNLFMYPALDLAKPGDVVVINGGADESRAVLGEIVAGEAKTRGVAGFVVDGAVRDADGLADLQLPVFARGVTPAGPYKAGPSAVLEPIAVGGVVVAPGDIVVGDGDGVVVVPLARAAEVLAAAEAKRDREEERLAGIRTTLAEQAAAR